MSLYTELTKLPSFWGCTWLKESAKMTTAECFQVLIFTRARREKVKWVLLIWQGNKGWRQRDQYQTGQMSLSTSHSPFLPASHFSFFLETCILFGIASFPSCFDKHYVATLTEGPVWWGGQVPETSPTGNTASGLVQASEYNPIFWYTTADSGYFAQWAMNYQGHWHCSVSYSSKTKFYPMLGFGTEKLYWC